jgi:hypothetical protein
MLLLLSLLLAPNPAPIAVAADSTRTVNGVVLPETITAGGKTLVLNGAALRKKAIFKVYVAALYVVNKSQSADAILGDDEPRRMEMHFVRGVEKKKICDAWADGLKDNTPDASEEVKNQFNDLCGLMGDVKDGQSMTFTYVPGNGTAVTVAGEEKGTVGGREFSDALLRCWIGPKPGPGEGFKKNLLSVKD